MHGGTGRQLLRTGLSGLAVLCVALTGYGSEQARKPASQSSPRDSAPVRGSTKTGLVCAQNGPFSKTGAITEYQCTDRQAQMSKQAQAGQPATHMKAACSIALPILCFRDINAPSPKIPDVKGYWSGGVVAATPPQTGDKFTRVRQVNAYCQALFGKDWRVLSYHDGHKGRVAAYGRQLKSGQKVWIDIRTQPGENCWVD